MISVKICSMREFSTNTIIIIIMFASDLFSFTLPPLPQHFDIYQISFKCKFHFSFIEHLVLGVLTIVTSKIKKLDFIKLIRIASLETRNNVICCISMLCLTHKQYFKCESSIVHRT